jgi:hypothetical protein
MKATFTVDAFPKEVFNAKVIQIRKDAQQQQNVVLYTVVLAFDNRDLKLMPYMTANIKFEIDSRKDVLCVPNIALRWIPTQEMMPSNTPSNILESIIDELYARPPSDHACIWTKYKYGYVLPYKVQRGITDGTMTEISGPDVKEGMEVITGTTSPRDVEIGEPTNPFAPKIFRRGEKQPTTPQPASSGKILTTVDGKIDKAAFFSLLRDTRDRQRKAIESGQCTIKKVYKTWREGNGEKLNKEPRTADEQGMLYFDGENLRLDTTTTGKLPDPTSRYPDKHLILTKKWLAELDSNPDSTIMRLADSSSSGFLFQFYDPRVISRQYFLNLLWTDIKKITFDGRECYRLERTLPGSGVRGVQIIDPEKDFAELRRETYYDNSSRKANNKMRDDYPFSVEIFDYHKNESSGVWMLIKLLDQDYESIPLGEKRDPTLDKETKTEFTEYSFNKPPVELFTLYNLSQLGATRLVDNRKGHAENNWYDLPSPGNMADPFSKPDVKNLPSDIAEEWLKNASAK